MIGTTSRANSWLTWAQSPREQGGLGLAPHQAAGLVGNLVNESGQDLSPWGPTGDNGTAWGTAQWRGDRLDKLKAMFPDNYQTTEAQQAFMRHEMDTSENGAYKALLAAQSPEDAATAVNRFYERSADTTGGRERAARQIMAQFGGQPAGRGALSFASDDDEDAPPTAQTGQKSMPALSADSTLGPGALNPADAPKGLLGLPALSDNTYDGLMGMAASLAGISSPDQAKALVAQQAAARKTTDQGTWSTTVLPNGQIAIHNSKRPMPIVLPGSYAKPEGDTYTTEAQKASAKANQEYGDNIANAAADAGNQATTVAELRRVFSNPAVYQGQGGDWVQSARKLFSAAGFGDSSGIADGDIARALSNKLALQLVNNGGSKLLPGSFSDSDRKFVQQMATSLNNDPAANQRLLDIYDRANARVQQAEQARQGHIAANRGVITPAFRTELGKLREQWVAEDKARNEAESKAPAAATAAPKNNTFKTRNGVTWSY